MTLQDLLSKIDELSISERKALIEAVKRTLPGERQATPPASETAVSRLRGLLKPDEPIPSDLALGDDYTRYLIEKYT